MHTNAFTQRSFYTQKLLHREVIIHTDDAFAHRSVYTEKPLHRSFYTQGRLHTDAVTVTQRSLYTESFNPQARLQTETFTQRSLYTESFYTRKLSHTEVFTQRSLYTEKLLRAEAFSHRSLSMNMLKKA